MKYQAVVIDVSDPRQVGRIKARLRGFGDRSHHSNTPWCWPCVPFAGPGYGFFCLPNLGDEVWVEQAADGSWIWSGFFWSGRHDKPAEGSAPDVRVLRTPVGHQLKLDESGDVEFIHSNGDVIAMRQNGDVDIIAKQNLNITVDGDASVSVQGSTSINSQGDVDIEAAGDARVTATKVELNGSDGDVVTTMHPCQYTGLPHGAGSATVKAGG